MLYMVMKYSWLQLRQCSTWHRAFILILEGINIYHQFQGISLVTNGMSYGVIKLRRIPMNHKYHFW
jgi:hypothetical protein